MKISFTISFMFLIFLIVAFGYTGVSGEVSKFGEIIIISDDIQLQKIEENVWIHTTYVNYPKWGKIPANGVLITDDSVAAIIDTPWTNRQTEILFDWIEANLKTKIEHVVVTHAHDDCMGGLKTVHKRGITTYSLDVTKNKALQESKPIPLKTFSDKMVLKLGEKELVLKYLGGGHTIDNIVVWVPDQKLLFGGCLVKPVKAKTLGNIKDADIRSWLDTLHDTIETFPSVKIVVPGHGRYGNISLIHNTINLCKNYINNN
jgi:metallo-beta-lactamase class B